ncbi:MAG: sulfurtransferase [Nitriliruptorales bacterium]|nr:sulfurtransferase [Nitriliruptorales bacterium]
MTDHPHPRGLSPREAAVLLDRDDPPLLVDVREPWERTIAALPNSLHVPMAEVPARVDELPRDRDIVLYCHHGARSMQVGMWLQQQSYDRLANLDGGIDGWSQLEDPEIPRYP